MIKACLVVAIATALLPQATDAQRTPAKLRGGPVPVNQISAVGGGEVLVELQISREGEVRSVTPLRTTPPFTEPVVEAVRNWRFSPAIEVDDKASKPGQPIVKVAVESNVLVLAVFRPPVLIGGTIGEAPKDIAPATPAVPLPLSMPSPAYPPNAFVGGVVLLEAHVDATGAVDGTSVMGSSPPFDEVARETVKGWKFRPAIVHGAAVPTNVYVIVGFRVPVG